EYTHPSMDEKKTRKYNEKIITKDFLTSPNGISFLSDNMKDHYNGNVEFPEDIRKDISNIIDYFLAWSTKFPLRRADKCTKYEFIKFIEDWCDKNDMIDVFSFLYD
ncbi:hypothetical protein P3W45_001815, partial [Vairimorpha bombi]